VSGGEYLEVEPSPTVEVEVLDSSVATLEGERGVRYVLYIDWPPSLELTIRAKV
jgi:hypothetical protein